MSLVVAGSFISKFVEQARLGLYSVLSRLESVSRVVARIVVALSQSLSRTRLVLADFEH